MVVKKNKSEIEKRQIEIVCGDFDIPIFPPTFDYNYPEADVSTTHRILMKYKLDHREGFVKKLSPKIT
jgi:hypothetical protein